MSFIPLTSFPALNASLNGTCAFLLLTGYFFIRNKKILAHKICMSFAFIVSAIFLVCYLYYHAHHGATLFSGRGWVRPVYFIILISHTLLAGVVLPLALITLYRAWKGQFDKHVKIARITFPIWLYVSITGVVIYWMLYR